jgi:hypothetical protein
MEVMVAARNGFSSQLSLHKRAGGNAASPWGNLMEDSIEDRRDDVKGL